MIKSDLSKIAPKLLAASALSSYVNRLFSV